MNPGSTLPSRVSLGIRGSIFSSLDQGNLMTPKQFPDYFLFSFHDSKKCCVNCLAKASAIPGRVLDRSFHRSGPGEA